AVEVRSQPAEGLGVLVDHRHAVPDLLEPAGDRRSDAAAAHHDHVHGVLLPRRVRCAAPSARACPARTYTADGGPPGRAGVLSTRPEDTGRAVCAGPPPRGATGRSGVRTIA